MDRRTLLRGLAGGVVAGGAGVVAACAGAAAPGGQGAAGARAAGTAAPLREIRWRMATSWDPSLDIINSGAVRVAQQVAAMTGGRFQIEVVDQSYPDAVAPHKVLDAVADGAVEAGHSASYYYLARHPAFAFATTVPFGLNAQQQSAWLYSGGGLELLRPLFARHANVITFPAGSTGVQMGGWFTDEVYTEDDLRQVSMRIPGLGAEVLGRMGVATHDIPAAEIGEAFRSGRINAAEFVGPYDDEKLGLQQLASFYYFPGWWEPGTTNDVYVSLDRWRELSPEDQAVVEAACRAAHAATLAEYDAKSPAALQRLRDGGAKLRLFNDRILAPARRAAAELHREQAAANAEYAAVYQQWEAFRGSVSGWHWYNEISYMNSVIREFSP